MGKASKNFLVEEFVPQKIYEKYGDSSLWFMDSRIIELAQYIREYFGKPMTINNWKNGGRFNYRGFRNDSYYYRWNSDLSAYESKSKGKLSQHRMGRAIDFNIAGMECDEVRAEFLKNEQQWLDAGLTTIEDGNYAPTWVHIDIRYTGKNNIFVVKP